MTLFTEREVTRTIFGWVIPAPEFTSLNPAFILLFAPVLAWLWPWLAGRKIRIDETVKFVLGLLFVGLAYLVLSLSIFEAADGAKTAMTWVLLFYMIYTIGELCLSPVGLALTTALAPRQLAGFAMGIWFLAIAAANYISGLLAQFADVPKGAKAAEEVAIYNDAFLIYGAVGLGVALALFFLVPWLRRLMALNEST